MCIYCNGKKSGGNPTKKLLSQVFQVYNKIVIEIKAFADVAYNGYCCCSSTQKLCVFCSSFFNTNSTKKLSGVSLSHHLIIKNLFRFFCIRVHVAVVVVVVVVVSRKFENLVFCSKLKCKVDETIRSISSQPTFSISNVPQLPRCHSRFLIKVFMWNWFLTLRCF